MEEIEEGDGQGGKGRFWGGGNRQSHRGSALSLTGWGSSPKPQGKGVPSDSTTCRPSDNPSPLSRSLGSPPLPFSPAHTAAPQPPARSFARLLTSLPSLGYSFAQIRPLAVLHTLACEAFSTVELTLPFSCAQLHYFSHTPPSSFLLFPKLPGRPSP